MPSQSAPLTIRFEHNGETTVYEITDATTLTIKGQPMFSGNTMRLSESIALTVDGIAPWLGERVVVNIAEVNIRHEPNTEQAVAARVKQGTELTVMQEPKENIGFLWREIVQPIELRGKWIAQQKIGVDEVYIVPAEGLQAQSLESLGAGGGGEVKAPPIETKTIPEESVSPPPQTPDNEPSALTGRFQLVKKNGPHGQYTALAIDSDSSPKLGVNIREFPHFGIPQWKWADPNSRAQYCQTAKDVGMKWVRFFTPHITYGSLQENIDRIGQTLDVIRDHGLLAVVTLTDSLADVGMFPKEDGEWHEKGTPMGHYHKDYFNTNSFRHHYHPYVKQIVSTFKDHAGVGIWQLMNEPAIYMPPASDDDVAGFARWVDETSDMIYQMDTVHPIAIGMINVSHIKPPQHDGQQFAIDFYKQRKHIHIVSCHSYQSISNGDPNASWDLEDQSQFDIVAAAKTGRAMFWTEFGASQASNRKQSTDRFLRRQMMENRASALLQWGFMITGNDTGIGDRHFGWSPASINKEYNELRNLFAHYAASARSL